MHESGQLPPQQVEATSTRLLSRIRQHDPEAWRQLVQLYGPVVRYWIHRAGLQNDDLADVFQEVFLAVSRSIGHFKREEGQAKFRAWLKTVVQSKVYDHHRRRAHQPQALGGSTAQLRLGEVPAAADDPSALSDQDAALSQSEEAFITQRTLQMVKQEFRDHVWQSFHLTTVEGLTSQEAATRLGVTPLAVRKAKSRVLQRLKSALGRPDPS